MKRIIKIVFKVVLAVILLFLCLSFKPHEARAEFFNGGIFAENEETQEESQESTAIAEAIDNEDGGMFETTIAKALGGIAQAVFNIASSDTLNLGFKDYDELIFNKTIFNGLSTENISPSNTWIKIMKWYKTFSSLAFIPILIGSIVTSYKFIIAGTSITRRNEAKDALMRLVLGGVAIALAPIFVKLVLLINSNMVSALVSTTTGGLNNLFGNSIFTEIKTGSAIATALVICLFAYYLLEEKEANVVILSVQDNKFEFEKFLFELRKRNIRVILLLENEKVKEAEIAL